MSNNYSCHWIDKIGYVKYLENGMGKQKKNIQLLVNDNTLIFLWQYVRVNFMENTWQLYQHFILMKKEQ